MSKLPKTHPDGTIPKTPVHDGLLKFSFKMFDNSDGEMCPPKFQDGYTQTLMQRLKDLSSWTISEFCGPTKKSVRNHPHDWSKTARPKGFAGLPSHLKDSEGWQFAISANKYGRVHGIIIGEFFYIIWLDQDHKLNPGI